MEQEEIRGVVFRVKRIGTAMKRKLGCIECGTREGQLDTHHIVPQVFGGTAAVVLCKACHEVAHSTEALDRNRLTSIAMQRMRQEGRSTGVPPFGMRATDDGGLEEDPDEQETIRKVFAMREEGVSIRGIAKALNEDEEAVPRGKAWHPTTIARLLQGA